MAKRKKIYNSSKIKKILDVDIYPRGGGKIDLSKFIDTVDHLEINEELYLVLEDNKSE